jgi:hypothetical protein
MGVNDSPVFRVRAPIQITGVPTVLVQDVLYRAYATGCAVAWWCPVCSRARGSALRPMCAL